MLRKAFLATSALVVASSMALAHPQASHQSLNTLKQLHQKALANKGVIVSKKGMALGVKFQGKSNGIGKPAKFVPGGGGYSNFSKSKNALFISWFGWFAGADQTHSGPFSGSYCISYSNSVCVNHEYYKYSFSDNIHQSAAQPFTKVTSASQIAVGAAQYSGSGGASAAIYTSTGHCGNSATTSCPGTKVAGGAFNSAPAFTGLCCSSLETVSFAPVSLSKKKQYWVVLGQNGSNSGRVAWQGQASNWTAYPSGEAYNANISEVINSSYGTTRYGYHNTYHTSFNESTNGWIHTSAFTYEAQPGAFSVN